ncbi:MAG: LTA synthase family protein [Victivallaceae bacterium]
MRKGIWTSLTAYAVFALVDGALAGDGTTLVIAARLAGALGITLLSAGLLALPGRFTGYVAMLGVNFAFATLSLLETVSFYFSRRTFSFEFYFHLNPETLRHGTGGFAGLLALAFAWLTASLALLAWGWRQKSGKTTFPPRRAWLAAAAGLALLLLPGGTLHGALTFAAKLREGQTVRRLDPAAMTRYGIKAPPDDGGGPLKPGKNLILIYLESVENSYLQPRIFPGLLPNISGMMQHEAIVFADVAEARHSNFTVGGIYSSLTGSVLTTAHLLRADDRRDGGSHGFDITLGSRLETVLSILRRAGYEENFMVGCDPAFGGLNVFLDRQRVDRVDHAGTLLEPGAPVRQWGLRDRELFGFGLERYRKLTAAGRPFMLALVTIDPHNPDGFTEPDGPKYTGWGDRRPNLLDAIFATDHWLGNFVAELRRDPGWQNTVVVVLTDHLAKSNTLSPVLEKNSRRRLIAFALNAGPPRIIATPAKTFDLAPTILALLGIDHRTRFPLGENLLAPTAPDPRRLAGDSEPAEAALTALLRTRSDNPVGLSPALGVSLDPYPALLVAGRPMPLYVKQWGVQQLPVGDDAFAVRIGEDGRIAGGSRLNSADEARHFVGQPGIYAVLASPVIAEALAPGKTVPGRSELFYLLRGRPGAWRIVSGPDPTLLKIGQ